MGLAQSALPELARLSIQFTLLPFIMAIWFHNRALVGWAVAAAPVMWYQVCIRFGLGLSNPLTADVYPDADDLAQATYIYFVVLCTLIWVCAMCGTGVAWLLDLPYPIPAEALLPESPGHVISTPYTADASDARIAQQDAALTPNGGGLSAFGYSGIARPWGQVLVTIVAFLFSVALPFLLFEQVYTTSGWGAWLGAVACAAVFPLAFGVYLHFKAPLYQYGPTEDNMKARELQQSLLRKEDDRSGQDPDLGNKTTVYKRTIWNVWKFVLITGGLNVFGLLMFAGIATFADPAYVDTLWLLEICVIGALLIIVAIIAFVYWRVTKSKFDQAQLLSGGANSSAARTRPASDETESAGSDSSDAAASDSATATSGKYKLAAKARAADSFLGSLKTK